MFIRLTYLLKYYLYWIVYFIVLKLVFLVYYHSKSFELFDLWGGIFLHGLRLDLSVSGYLLLLPILVSLGLFFIRPQAVHQFIKIYTYIIIVLFSLLAVSDLALYGEWGYRMDATPLLYITKPKEAFASVSYLFIIYHLLIAAALSFSFIYIFKIAFSEKSFSGKNTWLSFSTILFFLIVLFLPIRGGVGKATINISSAYFSDNSFANHAAINLLWNIGYSLENSEIAENPYVFYAHDDAKKLASKFTKSDPSFKAVLKTRTPNILLIVLESFTANVTGCLSDDFKVTPRLDALASKGILFSRLYASGDRTDKGMLAIFSGYPSQPTTSIIKFPNKTENLPGLPKTLKNHGYTTHFYYGGDVNFSNYKSYLLNVGIDRFISLDDFPSSKRISSWGVPDEYLFERVSEDISSLDEPYFLSLFTLSSHPPYDVPMEPYLKGEGDKIKFCNSVYYTDYHLGKFIDDLEQKQELENTLVIIIADHGTFIIGNLNYYSEKKYHIPMIWYGDVLLATDTIVSVISNQTDLANTLLSQLNIDTHEYLFGKNIFAENAPQQILYAINNGFGFFSDSLEFYYNHVSEKSFVLRGNITDSSLMESKAYYQLLYEDLLSR